MPKYEVRGMWRVYDREDNRPVCSCSHEEDARLICAALNGALAITALAFGLGENDTGRS
jgi:hypothetical protein